MFLPIHHIHTSVKHRDSISTSCQLVIGDFRLPIRNSQILLALYESPHIIGEISLNSGTLAVRFVRKEFLNTLFHRLRHWSGIKPAIWSLVYSRMVSLFINRLYLFKLDSSELARLRDLRMDFKWVSRTISSFCLILMANLTAMLSQ